MRDVIDGENHSTRAAKDFVVSRIVEETEREITPIPATKRQPSRNLLSPVVNKWNCPETDDLVLAKDSHAERPTKRFTAH